MFHFHKYKKRIYNVFDYKLPVKYCEKCGKIKFVESKKKIINRLIKELVKLRPN